MVDPSVSSTILDEFCTFKDADFPDPSDCLVGNFSTSQDVQSQITSASLADSQAFSRPGCSPLFSSFFSAISKMGWR